jgi:putative tricarboxylic transport membrane protein
MTVPVVAPTAAARRRTERLAGAAVALAGLVLLVASLLIPEPARQSPGMGPRVLPSLVSVGLLVAGVLLVLTASRRADEGLEDTILADEDQDEFRALLDPDEPPVPWRGLIVVVGMLVAYAVLFFPLGFVLSTTLFLGAVTTYADPRRWVRNWVFAAALAVVVYLLFTRMLAVVLPAGLLG